MLRAEEKAARPRGAGWRSGGGPGLLLLALGALAGLVLWAARAEPGAPARQTGPAAGRERAAWQHFRQRCARCHGEDGTGGPLRDSNPEVPDFRSRTWHRGRSDTELLVTILEGKGRRMPAFGGRISEQEARELVKRIRAFSAGPARPAAASSADFDGRFRELQKEMEDLKRQFRELASEPRKS
jgi:mono/diheme cytochrome c family protein